MIQKFPNVNVLVMGVKTLSQAKGLTIKKLTHGNPTMKAKFDALEKNKAENDE